MRKLLMNFNEEGISRTNALIALGFAAIIAFVILRISTVVAAPINVEMLEAFGAYELPVTIRSATGMFFL